MTAAKIFGISIDEVTADQRRIAKTANFGIMYGISAFGLSQRLHIGRAEAKKIIEERHYAPTWESSAVLYGRTECDVVLSTTDELK